MTGIDAARLDLVVKAYDIRGVVPDQLDAEMIEALGAAFARFALDEGGACDRILIAHDMRPTGIELSEAFARGVQSQAVDVVHLGLCSTDELFFAAGHYNAPGAQLTASHNPAQYNGIKWMPYWGGSASPAVTNDLERRIELLGDHAIKTMSDERSTKEAWTDKVDFRKSYFDQLESLLDVKAIKKAKLKVGIDAMHGSARLYLRSFLEERLGVEVFARNEDRDVLLGGISPEPTPESTAGLAEQVKKQKLSLGLACDGDGDRFGIIDAGGVWIQANEVIALAYEHLVVNRGLKGKAARSVMTSHFIDAVAKSHGSETRETPVGFKYLGELLRSGPFLIAGEESGGLSIRGHVPEKDGILACVLMLELVAFEKKPLAVVRDRLFKKLGAFHGARLNYKMERLRDIIELEGRLKVKPPLELAGASVWRIDQSDGFKFILRDGSWLGLRSSGTEPVFRVYAEAHTPKKLAEMIDAGKKLLQGKF